MTTAKSDYRLEVRVLTELCTDRRYSGDSSMDELRRVDEIVKKVTEPSKPPPETPRYIPPRRK